MIRSFGGLAIAALTIALLFLAGFQLWQALETRRAGPGGGRPVGEQVFTARLLTVVPGPQNPLIEVFGTVQARRSLQMRAQAAGRIVQLDPSMHEGSSVSAGQFLLRIDPAPAQAQVAVAEAAHEAAAAVLAEAQNAVGIARDDLTAAEEQATLRRAAVARQEQLAGRGLGTSAEAETVRLAASTANQAVLSRRSALASAEAAVDSATISLRRAGIDLSEAQRALDQTALFAGFDGQITNVTASEGGLVSVNEQLAELIDPAALEVQIILSLDQFARLSAAPGGLGGTPAQVMLDGSAGRIAVPAVLDRAAASVAQGSAGRTVFARIEGSQSGLRPGDFVAAAIAEPPLDDAAAIPAAALGGDGAVLVVDETGRLSAVVVQVLRRQGDQVLIAVPPGLAGARIVAERAPQLGVGIRVRDAAAPADEATGRSGGAPGNGRQARQGAGQGNG
ncbi:MAG: HlyD family efflux transporter periplasmic adaptor subunit [Paracoccus sp. (in: a-proteobacteria)]|uniref:efflux RND transporter periplasmic adaptor subunit n=1 Tax=Paracoccus sp. TaxID=267 RepID=UPI0026E065A5|nr:HlyD family efflux transporter periplasmic adaptor subunit [Paracoccus sp. (in: a-proteobacteria)]MDO5612733.1 HlyD family efflux transporter periplasmic adaptor subunit [Paracoccus sp. (in: a-proteobacteria)]